MGKVMRATPPDKEYPVGTYFYRVGQFTGPAPADEEEFREFIESGEAEEVSKEYRPFIGDAVYYRTPLGEIGTHVENWDTSD